MCPRGTVFVHGLSGLTNVPSALHFSFLVMERIADRSGFGGISFVELCMTFDIDLEEQPFHAQTVSYLIC